MRLIDGDKLTATLKKQFREIFGTARKQISPESFFIERLEAFRAEVVGLDIDSLVAFIDAAQTIDAVEVVRCNDCDWYRDDGSVCVNPKCGKSWYGCRVPQEHYCSFGNRRTTNE